MIPYSYNMVSMRGVDLAKDINTALEGIYSEILVALNNCRDLILYDWFFAEIPICPQYTHVVIEDQNIVMNNAIVITPNDVIALKEAIPPVYGEISIDTNGIYAAVDYGYDAFSAVTVDVRPPVEMIPDSHTGPAGTTGNWTPSTGYNGYYTAENVENAYFLLEYDDPFKLYSMFMKSSSINNSKWIFIFEYRESESGNWVQAYQSTEPESGRDFLFEIIGRPVVDAIRWRTTTKKVYPFNILIPEFYATGVTA